MAKDASDGKAEGAAASAAQFPSSLHMVAYRINAFDVKVAGTRRTVLGGFPLRALPARFVQMPNVMGPKIEQLSQIPMSSMGIEEGEAGDEPPCGK